MREIDITTNQRVTYILIGIMLLATALRLYHINYQSLWYDELHSVVPTGPENTLSSLIEYAKGDQPPVFFIYIHYVFKIFGYDEFVGRVACAVIGILSILVIYFLGKECQGVAAGLFAALLTTVNYFHIYYSQELRFYSLTFLFSALSYLFYIRAFKRGKILDYIGYVLFTTCLLYTHYYGMFIFFAQILTFPFLLVYKRDFKFVVRAFASGLLIIVAFLPWVPIIIRDMDITSFWIKRPEPYFTVIYFYDYTGKDALTAVLYIALIIIFIRTYKSSDEKTKPVYRIVILWIVWSYLLPYIRSITSTPILHERYTIGTLPGLIMIFSIGWDKISGYKWRYSIPILLVLASFINLAFFKQHYTRVQKDQFREASEIVKSNNSAHYPVYSGFAWQFNFYFRNSPEPVKSINTSDLSEVEAFWLLQGHYPPEEMEAEITKFMEAFNIAERHSFYGANAVLLRRK